MSEAKKVAKENDATFRGTTPVLLADYHAMFREGLAELLASYGTWK